MPVTDKATKTAVRHAAIMANTINVMIYNTSSNTIIILCAPLVYGHLITRHLITDTSL